MFPVHTNESTFSPEPWTLRFRLHLLRLYAFSWPGYRSLIHDPWHNDTLWVEPAALPSHFHLAVQAPRVGRVGLTGTSKRHRYTITPVQRLSVLPALSARSQYVRLLQHSSIHQESRCLYAHIGEKALATSWQVFFLPLCALKTRSDHLTSSAGSGHRVMDSKPRM